MLNEIVVILQSVTFALVVYIWRLYTAKVDKVEKKGDTTDREVATIKYNYLDRFNRLEVQINKRFDDLNDKIDDKYVTKEFCELQHKK